MIKHILLGLAWLIGGFALLNLTNVKVEKEEKDKMTLSLHALMIVGILLIMSHYDLGD